MKTKCFKAGFLFLFLMVGGLVFTSGEASAQTQGDVAIKLATLLGMNITDSAGQPSAQLAITALTNAGITPAGGWNAMAPATPQFLGALFAAVNNAVLAGKITPPARASNASALVAAAATSANLPSNEVVNAISSAGGDKDQASTGASFGVTVAAASTPGGGSSGTIGLSPSGQTGGSGGGGGGGAITQSQ